MVIGIVALLSAIISAVICVATGAFGNLDWLWMFPVGWLGWFLGIILVVFLFIWIACAFVKLDREQKEDSAFFRALIYMVADAAHTVLQVRVRTQGLEKVPTKGRVFLVCNHLNNADPVIIMHQLKRYQKLAFIAKREAGSMFIVGKLMHKILCQRINRENDREALKTILSSIGIIKEDKASIAVFPEGGIRGGNVLHPFRHGVFKIALRTQVPIVVCTLWGSQDVFHNGLRLKPTQVDFHVLGVVEPETYKGMTTVDLGHMVHAMMAEDLGPERVLKEEETT